MADNWNFLDLYKGDFSRNQYRLYWFCEVCEALLRDTEDYAAKFCDRLEANKEAPQVYNEMLLRFAVSISMRTAMFDLERRRFRSETQIRAAIRVWKAYLLNKRRTVSSFTQHLFLIFAKGIPLHKGLGGQLFPNYGVVLSQIGPLFIVGLLNRAELTLRDIRVWDDSNLLPAGGTINPVKAWHLGKNATWDLKRLLAKVERLTKQKVMAIATRGMKRVVGTGRPGAHGRHSPT